jgi:hypothetical protein
MPPLSGFALIPKLLIVRGKQKRRGSIGASCQMRAEAGACEVRGQWTRSWKLGDRTSAHEAREALHSAMHSGRWLQEHLA